MSGPKTPITVAELFAGVGGFRLGLEGHPDEQEDTGFKVVFSNQWEPDEKAQWASKIYEMRFGKEGHTDEDIHKIAFNEGQMAETIREGSRARDARWWISLPGLLGCPYNIW